MDGNIYIGNFYDQFGKESAKSEFKHSKEELEGFIKRFDTQMNNLRSE